MGKLGNMSPKGLKSVKLIGFQCLYIPKTLWFVWVIPQHLRDLFQGIEVLKPSSTSLFSLSTCWYSVRGRAGDETVTQPFSQRADRHDRRKLHLPGVVKQLHSLNGKELAPCLGAGVKCYLSLSLTWMSIFKGWSNPHLCVTVIIYSTVTFLLMSLEIYLILLPPLSMAKDLTRREPGSPEFQPCVNTQIFQ